MTSSRKPGWTALLAVSVLYTATAAAQQATPADPAPPAPPSSAPAPQKPKGAKPDRKTVDEAKRAYAAGEMAYQAGDYKSAIQNFSDAQNLLYSPLAAYWLAASYKADGQIPQAIAELKALLESPGAEKIGPEKLAEAKQALEELQKAPSIISVSTEPPGATIAVDGQPYPGQTPVDVQVAPGRHEISVALQGYEPSSVELEMPPGSKGDHKFALVAIPPPPAAEPGVVAPPPKRVEIKPKGDEQGGGKSRVGTYVVLGLAGAGAVTGAVFGIMAVGNKSDFDENPSNETADDQERNAIISDIGFGVALTLGLTGLVMLTARDEPEGRPAPRSASVPRLSVAPYASARGAGAAARMRF